MTTLKILLISDTHGTHWHSAFEVTGRYDVLIHAGDFTDFGRADEVNDYMQWLEQFTQFDEIVYIAGNHDLDYEAPSLTRLANGTNLHYLYNSGVYIKGVKFYGSPYTPRFFDWAFMYDPQDASEIWSKIPADTDVLITHGPPHGILDKCPDPSTGELTSAGCPELLRVVQNTPTIKLHVFGHIHEGHGVVQHSGGRVSVNAASICGELRHAPIEFDLESG